ncbi:efflux RND transporter periplasmic adaptor subunit [Patescibacteria group bacterium]
MNIIKTVILSPMKFLLRRWKLTLILLVIFGLTGIIQYRRIQANTPELIFGKVKKTTITKTLESSGVVDAKEKARLRFLAGGKIVFLGAQEGDIVQQWQTIATIDQASLRKQMQQDLNAYMQERWDWENILDDKEGKEKYDMDDTERRAFEIEQWNLDKEVLDVEIKNIAINNTVLSAPFTGILTHTPTNVAGVQIPATDYFELINPETLIFRANIDEADIASVKKGLEATLELDAYPGEIITTTVNYISYTSSQDSSGTVFHVEFTLNDSNLDTYRIGMNGDIDILLETKHDVLIVPIDAVRERDDKAYVDIKTGEKSYEERKIILGLENDTNVEILEGLNENDEVLLPE